MKKAALFLMIFLVNLSCKEDIVDPSLSIETLFKKDLDKLIVKYELKPVEQTSNFQISQPTGKIDGFKNEVENLVSKYKLEYVSPDFSTAKPNYQLSNKGLGMKENFQAKVNSVQDYYWTSFCTYSTITYYDGGGVGICHANWCTTAASCAVYF